MKLIASVALSVDLSEFTEYLWKHQIPHRVVETEQEQQLWVAEAVPEEQIIESFEHWRSGGVLPSLTVRKSALSIKSGPTPLQVPLTSILIVLSVVMTFVTGMGSYFETFHWLTITDLVAKNGSIYAADLYETLSALQFWRLLTPAFLHFSLMHLLFNLLWIWVAGGLIEQKHGRGTLLSLFFLTAILPNIAQYFVSGPLFGGMSGVVYGLIGYVWLSDKLGFWPRLGLPKALIGFMLFWLMLGYSGLLTWIGLGSIANTAHLAGLLSGFLFVGFRYLVGKKGSDIQF